MKTNRSLYLNPDLMNTYMYAVCGDPVSPGICLRHLVDELVGYSLLKAADTASAVINEVNGNIFLQQANPHFAGLLKEIIHTVIINSKRGDIHINARRAGSKLVLKIQERNNNNGYALSFSIGTLMPEVNSAGGDLMMEGKQQRVATIVFTFPDRAAA